ncbi:hypothetical protein [Leptolyngbya sp. FACHB-16]|uniref:hypothetical protein n=1 Tax=unclassified Leptolyngbya TaxID=2650499 RepID=UPI0016857D46|nr:hypothetical protein [Leptolyngbya sp. FACHB-16]MBD2156023.1 hypothetical protein [Leptolyngbya sp. FACHB-16]
MGWCWVLAIAKRKPPSVTAANPIGTGLEFPAIAVELLNWAIAATAQGTTRATVSRVDH